MRDYPKHIKRLLRQYVSEAYERELHRELTKLAQSFTEWQSGSISSGELSERVHRYETGPFSHLYISYNDAPHDIAVAYAIVTGILNKDEIPGELLEAIRTPINYYQSLKDRNELREPGDYEQIK
jgi:hypothetical protein